MQLDEKAIFDVAPKIGSQEARLQYLQQVCGNDKVLLDRVVALTRMHDQQPSFLETPLAHGHATSAASASAEGPGTQIGPYELLEKIGEGGMGAVYLALQAPPIRRQFTLKIIKPGMDTREVVRRFEAERQALALMDQRVPPSASHAAETARSPRCRFVGPVRLVCVYAAWMDTSNRSRWDRSPRTTASCSTRRSSEPASAMLRRAVAILLAIRDGGPPKKMRRQVGPPDLTMFRTSHHGSDGG